ncbi:MAG: glycosyltransferase family 2 protein [Candidatus Firestonebacteria bacterium]|nr:glycosyltransferase family 2 protein [Candidatus Firestonebacteria bacterium]
MSSKAVKPKITAVIIASQAEATISACVRSLGFCTDIVVGVNASTDRTAVLAKRAGARVVAIKWDGYARTKNALLDKVRQGWVLSMDSDEVVSPELAQNIQTAIADPQACAGYWLSRRNYFLGHRIDHSGWSPDWQLRLFRAGCGRFSDRRVHEALQVAGETRKLAGPLDHYTYATVSAYLQRLNAYTTLAAQDRRARGKRDSRLRLIFDPGWTFFKMYVIKSGWRDGFPGLALGALSALNTLVKHAKHWESEQRRTQ